MLLGFNNDDLLLVDDLSTSLTHFVVMPRLCTNVIKTHTSLVTDETVTLAGLLSAKLEIVRRFPEQLKQSFNLIDVYAPVLEAIDKLRKPRPSMLFVQEDEDDSGDGIFIRFDYSYLIEKLRVIDSMPALQMLVGSVAPMADCIRTRTLLKPLYKQYVYVHVEGGKAAQAVSAVYGAAVYIQKNFENNGVCY